LKDLFDGMKVRELAEAYGASYASMVQALHKIPSSITKRVKQSELDKLYQASLQPETVPKPDTIDPVVVKTSSDDSNSPERTSPKIAINFNDALELTAQTLKLTTKSEELGLKMVFDPSLRQPVMNETVQEIRESLGLLIDLVQDSNTNYRLDDLEEAVLRTLVGRLDKQLPALSWTSTQGRESGRLKDAHRNMINVVSVGLAKVHYARKEAARQHDRVI
jgi:hypothetical protein